MLLRIYKRTHIDYNYHTIQQFIHSIVLFVGSHIKMTTTRVAKSFAIAELFQRNSNLVNDIETDSENDIDNASDSCDDEDDDSLPDNLASVDDESTDSSSDEEPPPLRRRIDVDINNGENLTSPNGQQWSTIPPRSGGQRPSKNTLRLRPGVTAYATTRLSDETSAFELMFDSEMTETVIFETNRYGKKLTSWRELNKEELYTFYGLCILRGLYRAKGESLSELWSVVHGRQIFRNTMSLSRFREIQRCLRFDNPETRAARLRTDKLAAVRLILDGFTANSKRCFVPGEHGVTVDEQLYPYRGRCRFIQYIPTKPSKYGLKFWALNDSETGYCWNLSMYTGKDELRNAATQLGEHVVLDLSKDLDGSGIGITVDNYFCSLSLARSLLSRNMTLLGSVRHHRREIPKELREHRGRDLHSSKFAYTVEDNVQLVSYKAKRNKVVLILSSQHDVPSISDTCNKKPNVIGDYNRTKCGTDKMDQLVSSYSVKFKTRRWPVVVFCNLLDISCINAYILYTLTFPDQDRGRLDRRRRFLTALGMKLTKNTQVSSAINLSSSITPQTQIRGRCHLCERKKDQKQRTKCTSCSHYICKEHSIFLCLNCR